jgi:hypothetical protein
MLTRNLHPVPQVRPRLLCCMSFPLHNSLSSCDLGCAIAVAAVWHLGSMWGLWWTKWPWGRFSPSTVCAKYAVLKWKDERYYLVVSSVSLFFLKETNTHTISMVIYHGMRNVSVRSVHRLAVDKIHARSRCTSFSTVYFGTYCTSVSPANHFTNFSTRNILGGFKGWPERKADNPNATCKPIV